MLNLTADDMSDQAVQYRRMIQFADTGYSGPQVRVWLRACMCFASTACRALIGLTWLAGFIYIHTDGG